MQKVFYLLDFYQNLVGADVLHSHLHKVRQLYIQLSVALWHDTLVLFEYLL